MRNAVLAAMAVAGVALLSAGRAEAREYRYCLVAAGDYGPGTCYYSTYQQCLASASGRYAYCQLNPHFAFAEQPRRGRRIYRDY